LSQHYFGVSSRAYFCSALAWPVQPSLSVAPGKGLNLEPRAVFAKVLQSKKVILHTNRAQIICLKDFPTPHVVEMMLCGLVIIIDSR
jgi:hypothetical protein